MPTITEKIIQKHLVGGVVGRGKPIAIRIDQTLTQDATGTMTYLQPETMGMDQVKTDLSISHVDHSTLQSGFESADGHKYLQTMAVKHGVRFSRPGNRICHQVHLEHFAKPQATLLGSNSHIPTAGGIGALAVGADGLDVTCAIAGMPFHLNILNIINVRLHGSLTRGVSSRDIILKALQILSVKDGVGNIIEYSGNGVRSLNIPQHATITSMGAELGTMTSTFSSDEATQEFLKKQHREDAYEELKAGEDAVYDTVIDIDLDTPEPMIAVPHSPDNVLPISEMLDLKVDQVAIGSCTNSSYMGMMSVADILKSKTVDPNVSLVISPGSRQVLHMISQDGDLSGMISVGARILESTCGPCINMEQSPITNALSLRTFNRSFYGRSGTLSTKVCLVSPETAAASVLYGYVVNPRTVEYELPQEPGVFTINDSMIIVPDVEIVTETEVVCGPNIKPLPTNTPLENRIDKRAMIRVGNNITTDHIAPAGTKALPYRSSIEKISEFILMNVKASFHDNYLEHREGLIIVGANYRQGSSHEHAALAPAYLGIEVVIARGFARIHHANLANFGIIPFTFSNEEDYDTIDELDELTIINLESLTEHTPVRVVNVTENKNFQVFYSLAQRDIETILVGNTLNLIHRNQS